MGLSVNTDEFKVKQKGEQLIVPLSLSAMKHCNILSVFTDSMMNEYLHFG